MLREEWTTSAHVLFSLFFLVVFALLLFLLPISPSLPEEEIVFMSGGDQSEILKTATVQGALPTLLKPIISVAKKAFDSVWFPLRFLFAFVTVFGIYQLLNLAYFTSPEYKPVLPLISALALSFPIIPYFRSVYPEIPAFFLVALGLALLQEMEEFPWSAAIVMSIVPGGLAWLHPQLFPLGLGLFLFSIFRFKKMYSVHKSSYFAPMLALFVLGGAGLVSYFYFLGQSGSLPEVPTDGWQSLRMAWSLLYESGSGLIYSSPFYLAVIPAAFWAAVNNRWDLLTYFGLLAVHYLAVFSLTPAYFDIGRSWMPAIPLAVPLVMPLFGLWSSRQRWLSGLLLLIGPARALWKLIAGVDLLPEAWKPLLTGIDSNYTAIFAWIAVSIGLCILLYPFTQEQEGTE